MQTRNEKCLAFLAKARPERSEGCARILRDFEQRDQDAKVIANRILANVDFWKEDLTKVAGLEAAVAGHLADIQSKGMKAALSAIVK